MTEPSPLFLESWVEFNCQRWGVRPIRLEYHPNDSELPLLRAILYTDKKGRILLPPRNPYLAISFQPTPAQRNYHVYRQWRTMASLLAAEIRRRGLAHFDLWLPPEVTDVRPWQWVGYRTPVRYAHYLDFPYKLSDADNMVRRQVTKANRFGCTCSRTTQVRPAFACFEQTETRHNFHLSRFLPDELEMAQSIVSEEHYRAYACYAPDGEVTSSLIVLHAPGARAIALLFGTKVDYLTTGVARLLLHYALQDLEVSGSIGLDFGGVMAPNVARAKEALGGRLMPFYSLEDYSWRQFLRRMRNTLKASLFQRKMP